MHNLRVAVKRVNRSMRGQLRVDASGGMLALRSIGAGWKSAAARCAAARSSVLNWVEITSRRAFDFGIALGCGDCVPFVGVDEALLDAHAAFVEDSEIEFGVGEPERRGLGEPLGGLGHILRRSRAFGIGNGQIVHRLAIAEFGGDRIPLHGLDRVGGYAVAALEQRAEPIGGDRLALVRCAFEPFRSFRFVDRDTVAVQIFQAHQQFGFGAAGTGERGQPVECRDRLCFDGRRRLRSRIRRGLDRRRRFDLDRARRRRWAWRYDRRARRCRHYWRSAGGGVFGIGWNSSDGGGRGRSR